MLRVGPAAPKPIQNKDGHGGLADGPHRDDEKLPAVSARPVLTPEQSAILRERLLEELTVIGSADEAAAWAHRNLPAKNSLTAADAQIIEARFPAQLAAIGDGVSAEGSPNACRDEAVPSAGGSADVRQTSAKQRPRSGVVRALAKTVRMRDKNHRKFVTRQPCLVCGRLPSDSHHLTFAQPRALGHRVSDEFTVPVCRIHHRELHRFGDEAAWWRKLNIDPLSVALRLWQHTRLNNNELAATGFAPSQVAQKPDMSVQDQAGTNDDAHSNSESPVYKDGESNAGK
jgi:hypothetical protein